MPNKITTASNEWHFGKIITNRSVFSIPYFQRKYVWTKSHLDDFQNDINDLDDHSDNVAFMGAIILYHRSEIPTGEAIFYDVIDGQQRILTCTMYLIAIADAHIKNREFEKAAMTCQIIINAGITELPSNFKVYPSGEDRHQFNIILQSLFQNRSFKEAINVTPKYLFSSGEADGDLAKQYRRIKRIVSNYSSENRLDDLKKHILEKITFVQLDLGLPDDATRVFERLNFRGARVTIGDLIRNEIFVDCYDTSPDELDIIYTQHWMPFYRRFETTQDFESFIFASTLILDPSINKSGIFKLLKEEWTGYNSPEQKIENIKKYQEQYCEIKYGNSELELNNDIKKLLNNLRQARLPDVVYPFLMKILFESSNNNIEARLVVEILTMLESYIMRRGLAGHEATGMYKIFVPLWSKTKDDFTLDNIRSTIKSYTSQPWPNNIELEERMNIANVSTKNVLRFFMIEYEKSLGGDNPGNQFEIEHILPKNPGDNYPEFDESDKEIYTNILANLIPLSSPLNASIQNSVYSSKRSRYEQDSMYKTPRKLAEQYSTWTKADLKNRSKLLFEFIKNRWEY